MLRPGDRVPDFTRPLAYADGRRDVTFVPGAPWVGPKPIEAAIAKAARA